ncbi:hypothetical protein, partial [Escherichia coli]|uniref:hypothetical protein n=1 Tax=Escherichia coli TaxID=562 RepID=UPI001C471509
RDYGKYMSYAITFNCEAMNPLQAKPITPDSSLARSRATKTNAISNISFCYRASLALSSIVLF